MSATATRPWSRSIPTTHLMRHNQRLNYETLRDEAAKAVEESDLKKQDIARALDCGALGIIVPDVETGEQAEELGDLP